jgi:hypothetical protein
MLPEVAEVVQVAGETIGQGEGLLLVGADVERLLSQPPAQLLLLLLRRRRLGAEARHLLLKQHSTFLTRNSTSRSRTRSSTKRRSSR